MKSPNTGASSTLSLYCNLLGVFQYQYSFHVLSHQITVAFLQQFKLKLIFFLKLDLFVQEKNIKLVSTERKIFKARLVFS